MTIAIRTNRRRVLALSFAFAAGGVLAACGATATSSPAAEPTTAPAATEAAAAEAEVASSEAVLLEVWHENWGELYNGLMAKIGDEFTRDHPDVTIKWTFNDNWREKWLTAVAGGTPPDCSFIRPWGVAPFAMQEVIMPLDEYFAEAGIEQSEFVESGLKSCLYGGKLYACPGAIDYDFLIYNKEVYRDAGLDPEKPPVTYADWVAHSEVIYKFSEQGDVERMGMHPSADGIRKVGHMYGGSFFDEVSGKVTCNVGGVVEGLEWEVENAKR